jgi:glycosyltransferase involved in cell wall biosynthesis
MRISPKVSIIVPVYNSAKHLDKCINSILNQSYSNFEFLLINDGSKDNSGNICDKYALIDERIKVYHKTNGGVSSARNFGITEAKGEYMCFVDSDDYVNSDWLLKYIEGAELNNADIVFQGIIIESESNNRIILTNSIDSFFEKKEINQGINDLLKKDWALFSGTCCKMYKTELIKTNDILYSEGMSINEDGLFTIEYCCFIDSIQTLSFAGYHYVTSNSTLTNSQIPLDLFFMYSKSLMTAIEKLSKSIGDSIATHRLRSNIAGQLIASIVNEYKNDIFSDIRLRIHVLSFISVYITKGDIPYEHGISSKLFKRLFMKNHLYLTDIGLRFFMLPYYLKTTLMRK